MEEFPTEEEPLDITETRQVKRITFRQVLNSAFDAFNVDRGGIFTLKNLLIDPGAAVRDYLGANRYHYTPPFRLLIITTAIALFLISQAEFINEANPTFSMDPNFELDPTVEIKDPTANPEASDKIDITAETTKLLGDIQGYFNLILWTFLPVITLFSFLFNLKRRFNFAEHLVFQTYMFSVSNIISFLFPLDHLLGGVAILIIYLLFFFYYIYGYKEFLGKSWRRSFFEMMTILIVGMTIWAVLLMITLGLYFQLTLDIPPSS